MPKTRSTTANRRTSRRASRRKRSNPFVFFDIAGIALIALALVTLVALCAGGSTGIFGRYVVAALHLTVGIGAYIIPALLALLGCMLIAGPLKVIPRNVGIGSLMLFSTIIAWASLSARAEILSGGVNPTSAGGYLGGMLASGVYKIGGDGISYILLAAIGAVGIYIIIDIPIVRFLDRLGGLASDWREAANQRAVLARETRNATPARAKGPAAEESRKRTLASIFGKGKQEEPGEEVAAVVQTARPPVKVNGAPEGRPEKQPRDGLPDDELLPVEPGEFVLPPTSLLAEPPPPPPRVESELKANIEIIERTLDEFKVTANVVENSVGPTVARYEIRLAPGIKVKKIVDLADNLAMALEAIDVRVEAPIPGKAAIGVEVPNKNRGIVVLREVVESKPFADAGSKLAFALGKDVSGRPVVADLAKMPHMLMGGATNAGKSICLNSLIASLTFRATPDELKMILIDPKRVELSLFDGIPHLACPVVKNVKQAAGILRAAVQEMEHRYELFSRAGARNIDGYNERMTAEERMPYMVIVVDELCDLMMQAAAEVEQSITRLAQLARATGIHLVIATQRPSVDVITGVIKANISSRIAFAVSSHHDSRTILDQKGAERLVGAGDMLFLPIDAAKATRIQGCYVSEREIEGLCKFLKDQRRPVYTIQPGQVPETGAGGEGGEDDGLADEFYEPSVRFVVNTGYCSTSMLQRKFKIGYTRAARIVDSMEQQGIVGPLDGAKPRQVLITRGDLASIFCGQIGMRMDNDGELDEQPPPAEEIRYDDEEE